MRARINLPLEIVSEILVRVPVRTLLRFKSVCKEWNTLISSTHFTELQLKRSSSLPKLMIYNRYTFQLDELDPMLLDRTNDDFSYPAIEAKRTSRFIGCSNGLVCVAIDSFTIVVWNPATRLSRRYSFFGDPFPVLYGFGFDSSTADYKVVTVNPFNLEIGKPQVEVFSLRSKRWRVAGNVAPQADFPCRYSSFDLYRVREGVIVNETMHWVVPVEDIDSEDIDSVPSMKRHSIIAFGLKEENTWKILLPEYSLHPPTQCYWCQLDLFQLGVLRGQLCFCVRTGYAQDGTLVWVMEDYGKATSWIKLISVLSVPMANYF